MNSAIFRRFLTALRQLKSVSGSERQQRRAAVNTALAAAGPAGRIISKAIGRSKHSGKIIDEIFEGLRQSGEGRELQREPPVKPPKPERSSGATPDPLWHQRQQQRPEPAQPSNRITIQTSHGQRTYSRSAPVVTGQMVPVSSSNVHSIGFRMDWDDPGDSVLLIRYKDSRKGRGGRAGSLYAYFGVHPDDFQVLSRAASKGEWVWDNLRIRGTVSGHHVPYMLKGISGDGYVPRQAVRVDDEEFFIGRNVTGTSRKTGKSKLYQSELPNQRVGRVVNRGEPNRGAPNRGRSNRRG